MKELWWINSKKVFSYKYINSSMNDQYNTLIKILFFIYKSCSKDINKIAKLIISYDDIFDSTYILTKTKYKIY